MRIAAVANLYFILVLKTVAVVKDFSSFFFAVISFFFLSSVDHGLVSRHQLLWLPPCTFGFRLTSRLILDAYISARLLFRLEYNDRFKWRGRGE